MQGVSIPNDVNVTTTRNYGETAKQKSDELLEHLLLATISVTFLVALFLGWRESGVVLLAIPVTLALTMPVRIAPSRQAGARRGFVLPHRRERPVRLPV